MRPAADTHSEFSLIPHSGVTHQDDYIGKKITSSWSLMAIGGSHNQNGGAHYQHPELEIVRAAPDYSPPNAEAAAQRKDGFVTFCHPPKTHNLGKSLKI